MKTNGITHVHQERFTCLCLHPWADIIETSNVVMLVERIITLLVVILFIHCLPYKVNVQVMRDARLEPFSGVSVVLGGILHF